MKKTVKGGIIGFLVGAVLEFMVVGCLLSLGDPEEDSTQYAWLIAAGYSLVAGLLGGMIGAVTGAVMDWRGGRISHRRLFCLTAGILLLGAGSLGPILGSLIPWQPGMVVHLGAAVIGLVLCFAVVLAPHHNKIWAERRWQK
jgi:hypothetical protein